MGIITDLILPLSLAFIMFSLGLSLTGSDFLRIIKQPTDFFLGAISQIVINKLFLLQFDFRPYLIIYAGLLGPPYVFFKLHRLVKRKIIEKSYYKFFYDNNNVKSKDYFFSP